MKLKINLILIGAICFVIRIDAQEYSKFTDSRDGKSYKTVKISTQTWMAENLSFKDTAGCWAYNDELGNVAIYGYMYSWQSAKRACPAGWHLPSDSEWKTFEISPVSF